MPHRPRLPAAGVVSRAPLSRPRPAWTSAWLGSEAAGQAAPGTVNSILHVEQFKPLGNNQHRTSETTELFRFEALEGSLPVTCSSQTRKAVVAGLSV